MVKIITDNKKIKGLLERGVENVYPSKEFLEKQLKSGKKLTMYLGIDPTGPTLHLGHAINLMKMKEWQEMGHEVVLLIGSFTGMIGDPTDKTAVRKALTRKQVMDNAKKYKKQMETFISFSGKNPAKLVYNHKWLDKLTLKDMAEIGMNITTQRLLERDMFQERIKKKAPIYFTELMYPLLQGYDSVAMGVDGEIGGNDQTFNMLVGRDLMKKMKDKEKFVITMKLLVDPTGKKMGKTEGNMVTLEDKPSEMFGKVMSWPDEMIEGGFKICTRISEEEMGKIIKEEARKQKLRLAEEIVKIYQGEKKSGEAREEWVRVFSKKELPDIEDLKIKEARIDLVGILLKIEKMSKSAAWRLVDGGAVKVNGEKELNKRKEFCDLNDGDIITVGKKKHSVRLKFV